MKEAHKGLKQVSSQGVHMVRAAQLEPTYNELTVSNPHVKIDSRSYFRALDTTNYRFSHTIQLFWLY